MYRYHLLGQLMNIFVPYFSLLDFHIQRWFFPIFSISQVLFLFLDILPKKEIFRYFISRLAVKDWLGDSTFLVLKTWRFDKHNITIFLLARPFFIWEKKWKSLLCCPVFVPQIAGTGLPAVTTSWSLTQLRSVVSGWLRTKLSKSSLKYEVRIYFFILN